jgi:succinate dehydrogenase / fumarate reductase cytochrome b subunit
VSGVLLAAGVPLGVYLLGLSLRNEEGWVEVIRWFASPLFKGVAVILIWAFAHHVLAGIRHLLSDFGVGSSLQSARRSAWLANVGGLVLAMLATAVIA